MAVSDSSFTHLSIFRVAPDGSLQSSSLYNDDSFGVGISGSYDRSTGIITFNDASLTGLILATTFYTGRAVPNSNGYAIAFFGSWTEQTLRFGRQSNFLGVDYASGNWVAFNPDSSVFLPLAKIKKLVAPRTRKRK
jgi:hypothetical protein